MEHRIDFAVGGQALIEGVMIRSPSWVTAAVRKPDNSIAVKKEKYVSLAKRVKILGIPVVRGMVMLIETMILGMKALNFSAEQALDEEPEEPSASRAKIIVKALSFATSIVISIALAIFLFKFVPLYITEYLRTVWGALQQSAVLFNLTDGLIRIAIFFLYIGILAQFQTFRRVFQYHGAEHKTIFAYEKGKILSPEHVEPESPRHPRCGTSFLIIVLIVSILILTLVPRHPVFWISFLRRLAVLPLIMGTGYEILKWTAKFQSHPVVRFLTLPGLATQYITTREPDEKQMEVAIAALNEALACEKNQPTSRAPQASYSHPA